MAGRLSRIVILAALATVFDVSAYRKKLLETSERKKEGTFVATNGTSRTDGTARASTQTRTAEAHEIVKTQIAKTEKSEKDEGKDSDAQVLAGTNAGPGGGNRGKEDESFARAHALSLVVLCVGMSSAAFNIL
eukprot:TRINITY_DN711_c0_g1_i1.p1 TRINITY_DN711_c0_g1~~TRINITY_DN711_c0_g1_i1.p1  ORF type:complete len:133 (+),score=25.30 TRINITY_DN711_c0_g1_i1:78-476(+)